MIFNSFALVSKICIAMDHNLENASGFRAARFVASTAPGSTNLCPHLSTDG